MGGENSLGLPGIASLAITGSGTLTADGSTKVGSTPGSQGELIIAGDTTSFIGTRVYVGYDGEGRLMLKNATLGSSDNSYIANSENAIGTAVVAGSLWSSAGDLVVGRAGDGHMHVEEGGIIAVANTTIGEQGNSTGAMVVVGMGTLLATDNLTVDDVGQGTLDIGQSGHVAVESNATIGRAATGNGVVTVDGLESRWTNSGNLVVGSGGGGTLNIRNAGQVTVDGNVWIDGGTATDGILSFGIGVNGFGLLDVVGDVFLGDNASLLVTAAGITHPTDGQQFTIVEFDGELNGTFTSEPGPTLINGHHLQWIVQYNTDNNTIEVAASVLAGDFDENGTIEEADLAAWQSDFSVPTDATHSQDDSDLDGDVDGIDFLTWQRQYGMSATDDVNASPGVSFGTVSSPITPASTGVPELNSCVLLLAALACSLRWRRVNRKQNSSRDIQGNSCFPTAMHNIIAM